MTLRLFELHLLDALSTATAAAANLFSIGISVVVRTAKGWGWGERALLTFSVDQGSSGQSPRPVILSPKKKGIIRDPNHKIWIISPR